MTDRASIPAVNLTAHTGDRLYDDLMSYYAEHPGAVPPWLQARIDALPDVALQRFIVLMDTHRKAGKVAGQ